MGVGGGRAVNGADTGALFTRVDECTISRHSLKIRGLCLRRGLGINSFSQNVVSGIIIFLSVGETGSLNSSLI